VGTEVLICVLQPGPDRENIVAAGAVRLSENIA
jgi:hypothetical protein